MQRAVGQDAGSSRQKMSREPYSEAVVVEDPGREVTIPTPKPAMAPVRIPIRAKTITFARIESLGFMQTSLVRWRQSGQDLEQTLGCRKQHSLFLKVAHLSGRPLRGSSVGGLSAEEERLKKRRKERRGFHSHAHGAGTVRSGE